MKAKEFKTLLESLMSGTAVVKSAKFRGTSFRASYVFPVESVKWIPSFSMLAVNVVRKSGDVETVFVSPSNFTPVEIVEGTGVPCGTLTGMIFYFFERDAWGNRTGEVVGEWFDSPEARDEYCRANNKVCLGYDWGTAACKAAYVD